MIKIYFSGGRISRLRVSGPRHGGQLRSLLRVRHPVRRGRLGLPPAHVRDQLAREGAAVGSGELGQGQALNRKQLIEMNIGKLRSVANECVMCVTCVKEKPKRQLSVQAHRVSRQPQLQTKKLKNGFQTKSFFFSNFIEAKKSQRLEPQNQKIATIV